MQNPKIIGVDLGTTNTVLAYLDEVTINKAFEGKMKL